MLNTALKLSPYYCPSPGLTQSPQVTTFITMLSFGAKFADSHSNPNSILAATVAVRANPSNGLTAKDPGGPDYYC